MNAGSSRLMVTNNSKMGSMLSSGLRRMNMQRFDKTSQMSKLQLIGSKMSSSMNMSDFSDERIMQLLNKKVA